MMNKQKLYDSVDKNAEKITALSDAIWDFSELSMKAVEPNKREAGVWLRGAHKGFGECSSPSRTKYATAPGRAHDTGNGV